MMIILTLCGAVLLMAAGDALVRGAIGLSLKAGLSATLISLTVVAVGTSAPELVVSIEAALEGSPDIALGNVVGSNISNVLLVVGIPALIVAFNAGGGEIRRSYSLMLAATFLFTAIAMTGAISRASGLVLLAALVAVMAYSYYKAGNGDDDHDIQSADAAMPVWKVVGLLLIGIAGLPLGAYLLIEGAREIALYFGLSEAAVGLTVVALGTSLPELAASTAAALRGRADVAIANVIGSNMLNLLAIIGVTAMIAPLNVSAMFQTVDIPVMVASSLLLAPFLIWRIKIGRGAGLAFLALYAAFVWLALGDVTI